MNFLRASLVGVAAAICLAGCGGDDSRNLPMEEVSGTVTHDGKPLTEGSVNFMHESGEMGVGGVLGPDGKYTLKAARGPNKILVQSREPEVLGEKGATGAPMGMPGKSRIPEKYSRFESSGFSLDVKEGQNSYDMVLTGEPTVLGQDQE